MKAHLVGAWLHGFVATAFVLGLLVGSFLNVVIHRVPRGESIVRPSSRCPACKKPIRPWNNIPVVSYLALRGHCRSCGARIPARYPLIEFLTACVFAAVAWRFGLEPVFFVWLVFVSLLIAAGTIDFDHGIIPDGISLGGLGVGLIALPVVRLSEGVALGPAVLGSVTGALLGAGVLWIVGFIHARVCAAFGRDFDHWPGEGESYPRPGSLDYWIWFPGIGFGDVKLLGMVGAFLGPVGVLETIIAASVLGLGVGIALAFRKGARVPFGFGPAIAAGAFLVLFLPEWLLYPA